MCPRYRLKTLGKDDDYLNDLLQGVIGEPENKGQRLLKDAYEEIQTNLANIDDKLTFLNSIANLETSAVYRRKRRRRDQNLPDCE